MRVHHVCVCAVLTGLEDDLADHEPPGVEAERHLDVLPHLVVERDDHRPRVLDQYVAHVLEHHRLACGSEVQYKYNQLKLRLHTSLSH